MTVQLDVTDDASVSAAAAWLQQQPGGLDVLINNAGIAGSRNAPHDVTADALRALTVQYARALPQMRINVVDPGYTATDLNHNTGTQTVEQGTDAIVRLATIGKDGPTGTFQDAAGIVGW